MDPSPEDRAVAGEPDGVAGTIHDKAGSIDAIETGVDACAEKATIGYQAAISLWIYEGSTIWGKYSAMLVANSLITASIGFSMGSHASSHMFSLGLPIAGIALCGLWFLLTKRSFDNYLYWISSARELEERYLHPTVITVSRGADFADGLPANLALGGKRQVLRMSRLGRTIRAAWIAYSAIIVFVGLYILFILDSW
jgi:hypothetical protein